MSLFDGSLSVKMPPAKAGKTQTPLRAQQELEGIPGPASVEVLIVGNQGTGATLRHAFENTNWNVVVAATPDAAIERLLDHPHTVVICEETPVAYSFRERFPLEESAPPSEPWADLLALTRKLSNPPKVIVASRAADDHLWADVLHQGGYDVLPLPLQASEALRMVSMAWLEWRHERESEGLLGKTRVMAAAG